MCVRGTKTIAQNGGGVSFCPRPPLGQTKCLQTGYDELEFTKKILFYCLRHEKIVYKTQSGFLVYCTHFFKLFVANPAPVIPLPPNP